MQQYEEQARLTRTSASHLIVVKGVNDGEKYVIKRVRIIPCKSSQHQVTLAYAVQEARLLTHLLHPNIVRCYDFFIEGQNHCMVLEYCSGGDLKQQIDAAAYARRGLEPKSILGWMAGIASAALHFHQHGVIHRDLKPSNIFLTALDGRLEDVRVGDFGAARQMHRSQTFVKAKPTGTLQYMAPEVFNEQPYNTSADVWSMGVILLHLMTLRAPKAQLLFRGSFGSTAQLARLETLYGAETCSCMHAMLQMEPAHRPLPEHILQDVKQAATVHWAPDHDSASQMDVLTDVDLSFFDEVPDTSLGVLSVTGANGRGKGNNHCVCCLQ